MMRWLLLFCLMPSAVSTAERGSSRLRYLKNGAAPPSWQTVYPDTNIVIPLFGSEGPRWRLDSLDRLDGSHRYSNLTARVPGDLVSDLVLNKVVGDPYFDNNLWEQQDAWLGPQQAQRKKKTRNNSKAERSSDDDDFKPCQKRQTRIWTYSTEVELDTSMSQHKGDNLTWQVVVESLQMGASVHWNGVFLANVTDQFLRYSLTLEPRHLQAQQKMIATTNIANANNQHHSSKHILSITFDPSIETNGRFMACAGGWDWAPYTLACDDGGRRIFTMGIVQPIYLIALDQVAVTHVVPKVYYKGSSTPRNPFTGEHADTDWRVSIDVHLEHAPSAETSGGTRTKYSIAAQSEFTDRMQKKSVVAPPNAISTMLTFDMIASKNTVKLWWPNGMGPQTLYHLFIGVVLDHKQEDDKPLQTTTVWISRRIGFRTAALITYNETAEASKNLTTNEEEGTGLHGLYFRINGALVMARGANVIPTDQLAGRFNIVGGQTEDAAFAIMVQSASHANMNMIRVWGGGKVLSRAFYDACDEYGILLYHDQMFVEEHNHGPSPQTKTTELEIQHMVRSLATHPSIVVWNGCNECQVIMGTKSEIYATFVLPVVAKEDDTRSIWPSSPSKFGWESGVDRTDCKPNGRRMATRNPSDHGEEGPLESHGPYMRAFSKNFSSANNVDQHFPYPDKPIKFNEGAIGPEYANIFSVGNTLRKKHWSLHGNAPPDTCRTVIGIENVCKGENVMAQRNYPCDSHIQAYFGTTTSLDAAGPIALQAQLYQCMIAQTLWMKAELERRRSSNSFGLLIWQLNENWPTGGWGLVEYSAESKGQVFGGRWKPLMHLLEMSLFRDVVAACGRNNRCYVRNDGMEEVNVTVTLEAWTLTGTTNVSDEFTFQAFLPGGRSSTARFQAPLEWSPDRHDAILINVKDSKSGFTLMEDNVFLWLLPKEISSMASHTTDIKVISIEPGPGNRTASITISTNHLALYVVLTTLAQGRFLENAFVLRPSQRKTIFFVPLSETDCNPIDIASLRQTLRVEHLSYYLHVKAGHAGSSYKADSNKSEATPFLFSTREGRTSAFRAGIHVKE